MLGPQRITREKHLDHMVKVVPLIVFAYGLQCYMIVSLGKSEVAQNGLLGLGIALVAMIAGFITYDLKHCVDFQEHQLVIHFAPFHQHRTICYADITHVTLSEKDQTFATLTLTTQQGQKYRFYFIDDADKILQWLEQKRLPESQLAA